MLDIKFVRDNPELVLENLKKRNNPMNLDRFMELEKQRRAIIAETENLKSQKNAVSKQISEMKKKKENADEVIAQMRQVGEQISQLDGKLREVQEELHDILLRIPNMCHESVPVGKDDSDNPEVRRWGEPRKFDFEPKAHWDIGADLDILDPERAAKVTGARFTFYKGLGARLERALINFMMDLHVDKQGYTEMLAPFIANKDSMTGTGQLPKFAEDMFKLEGMDYYLVPTGEVPATNFHRDEILDGDKLPEYYSVYTACFRAEAGSAGREHEDQLWSQFNASRQKFYEARNRHYDELHEEQAKHYAVKKELTAQARAIADAKEYTRENTAKMKQFGVDWKQAGSCGREKEDQIWKEFRAAMDDYFNGLKEWNEERHQQWRQRMSDVRARKQELIQNQKRQIRRMQDEMVGLLGQRAIDEMQEQIEDKEAFIAQLEAELADIDNSLAEEN